MRRFAEIVAVLVLLAAVVAFLAGFVVVLWKFSSYILPVLGSMALLKYLMQD